MEQPPCRFIFTFHTRPIMHVYSILENLVLRARSEIDGSALAVLCLKSQIPSTKLQINHKFQIPNRFKAIVFLFGILNFGHCYLFVFWDLLFEISIRQ